MNSEWPNSSTWAALLDNETVQVGGYTCVTKVIDCGEVTVPSGRLIVFDPSSLSGLQDPHQHYPIPTGTHSVKVTAVNISKLQYGQRVWCNAYASLIIRPQAEVFRRLLTPIQEGKPLLPDPGPKKFYGVGVDAGMVCFLDERSIFTGLPSDKDKWFDYYIDDWVERMVETTNTHEIVNVILPLARDRENMIIVGTAWGDGSYPVIGGFDSNGRLVSLHLDFFAVRDE
jgi:Protein of unknown function (DUF4241)